MSFTILFSALSFLALIVVFGVSYARKGLKTALMATGIAFVLIASLLPGWFLSLSIPCRIDPAE